MVSQYPLIRLGAQRANDSRFEYSQQRNNIDSDSKLHTHNNVIANYLENPTITKPLYLHLSLIVLK